MTQPLAPPPVNPDRALTLVQKRDLVERLFSAWLKAPLQRFGQLLHNSLGVAPERLCHVEDRQLAEGVEQLVQNNPPIRPWASPSDPVPRARSAERAYLRGVGESDWRPFVLSEHRALTLLYVWDEAVEEEEMHIWRCPLYGDRIAQPVAPPA